MSDPHKNDKTRDDDFPLKSSNILDGVANILGRLGELAEKGEELRKQALASGGGEGGSKGVFDFSMKFGNASGPGSRSAARGQTPNVRPTKSRSQSNESVVKPTPVETNREPHVEILEEEGHLLCIAEMPGVSEASIELSLDRNELGIAGKSSRTQFATKLKLPAGAYNPPTFQLNNGILEIKVERLANP